MVFRGTWVEAVGQGTRHRNYTQHLADPKAAHSPQRKWALDPSRAWVRRLSVHPYWHWIEGRALLAKSMPNDALYWHFKGINTKQREVVLENLPDATGAGVWRARRLGGICLGSPCP